MARRPDSAEEEREPSRAAGACVLVVLGGAVLATVFAVSPDAGVLTVWVVGGVAVWRCARRRVSVSSAPPPPEEGRPSCDECAGHRLVGVTPSETQRGMLIYTTVPPDRPNHTHVHIVEGVIKA